ncbi:glycosyltransferase family 87 protein [uncultured Micrococcus sp.]|uniref:glycosyltransferase family 87 protein n=1 Tax=uncultured Micrococcus sp. TaxID=114051 RepID=UPI0025E003C1|nr:glycosyltransferase 87 family protein [uncultured Micrococcus sp.]
MSSHPRTAALRPTGRPSRRWVGLLTAVTAVAAVVALLTKQWCRLNGWAAPDVHVHLCYSDFAQLFPTRGLAEGYFPFYTPLPEEQWMEYPALLAVVAGVTSWLVPADGSLHERTVAYFDINAVGVTLCWMVVVLATAYTARGRSRDALLVAVAPGIILTSLLNWDLWAVMLAALALWAWSEDRPALSGLLLGLGAAMKLYPLFFYGALLVLAIRTGRWRGFLTALGTGVAAWLAVNVPFMLTAFGQWSRFYTFSGDREVSFSSTWLALSWTGWSGSTFSTLQNGMFALCCAAIAYLGVAARHRPRVAQLCLLIVASFLLWGKVYSPQFVMWLIPLVVLANPRWRQFWIWQAIEVYHWGGVWMESARITSGGAFADGAWWITGWYASGIVAHVLALVWIMATVVRDILDPSRDPVRRAALADGVDPLPSGAAEDPGAGVFAGAADRFLLPPAGRGRQRA